MDMLDDKEHGHAAFFFLCFLSKIFCTFYFGVSDNGHATCSCSIDLQRGHAARKHDHEHGEYIRIVSLTGEWVGMRPN